MKILYYTHQFGYTTQTFVYNEIQSLKKAFQVKVVSREIYDDKGFSGNELEKVIQYEHAIIAKVKSVFNRYSPVKIPSFRKQWKVILEDFQPDLIIIPFGTIASRVLEYHDWAKSIPILIVFHGYDASMMLSNKPYIKRLTSLVQRKQVAAAYVSKNMQERVNQKGIQFNKEFILYCGVNTNQFKRTQYEPKGYFAFLQVSSFADKKGHPYTFRAYAKMLEKHPQHRKDTRLVIGGGGDKMKLYQALVKRLGIEQNVLFKGWVSVEENVVLMGEADCFIHHSITPASGDKEGIPTVLMEAMSMELPILSTRHSGIPELVEEGVHGYLVEERDEGNYALSMKKILDWNYKKVNREKVEAIFSEEKHAENLYKIVKELTYE